MNELQRKIIGGLRYGPLNYFDLANEIDAVPFHVRGHLKELKRDRYVRERSTEKEILWELTAKGWDVATGTTILEAH
jgi:hypothetical protein